jgi:hypothetical protein
MVGLRAEYGVESGVRWHVVPDLEGVALCNRLLSPIAEIRPISAMSHDGIAPEHLCRLCLAAFEGGVETVDDPEETQTGGD